MKIRLTVTIDLEDPNIYALDENGQAVGNPIGPIGRDDVGEYVLEAVSVWGGQRAPGDTMFPPNIKSVRVQGTGFDLTCGT